MNLPYTYKADNIHHAIVNTTEIKRDILKVVLIRHQYVYD